MDPLDPIARRLKYLEERKSRAKPLSAATDQLSGLRKVKSSREQGEEKAHRVVAPSTISRRAVESECNDFFDLRDQETHTIRSARHARTRKTSHRFGNVELKTDKVVNVPATDFGLVLADRRQKSVWLKTMRETREAQSDYERYSLEYVLRRRFDTVRAPHLSDRHIREQETAAKWERDVLFKAMQSAADCGLSEYVLVLTGPWTDKTLRTVREPDLFGRAVHYLLQDVFHSTQLRVRCNHCVTDDDGHDDCSADAIRLRISWDEVEIREPTRNCDVDPQSASFSCSLSASSTSSLLRDAVCRLPPEIVKPDNDCSVLHVAPTLVDRSSLGTSSESLSDSETRDTSTEEHLDTPAPAKEYESSTILENEQVQEYRFEDTLMVENHSSRSFVFAEALDEDSSSESIINATLSNNCGSYLTRSPVVIPKTLHEEMAMKDAKTTFLCLESAENDTDATQNHVTVTENGDEPDDLLKRREDIVASIALQWRANA